MMELLLETLIVKDRVRDGLAGKKEKKEKKEKKRKDSSPESSEEEKRKKKDKKAKKAKKHSKTTTVGGKKFFVWRNLDEEERKKVLTALKTPYPTTPSEEWEQVFNADPDTQSPCRLRRPRCGKSSRS